MAAFLFLVPCFVSAEEGEGRTRFEGDGRTSNPFLGLPRKDPYPKGRPYRRPFDDRDPEMQYLAQYAFSQGPCHSAAHGKPCLRAGDPLREGGDRLARYLIAQYEASLDEGYPDTWTIVTSIGGTESDTGLRYMERMIKKPRSRRERLQGFRGLGRCGRRS